MRRGVYWGRLVRFKKSPPTPWGAMQLVIRAFCGPLLERIVVSQWKVIEGGLVVRHSVGRPQMVLPGFDFPETGQGKGVLVELNPGRESVEGPQLIDVYYEFFV